jgi:nitrogen-specific signal transduction histidine kinase/CheY-like chemotaxis protein
MSLISPALSRTSRTRVPEDPLLRARDERLESLRAVAGKLSHDFNNFLVPQFGYLTLLKEEIPAASQALQYANMMEMAARKTEGYIEAILLGMRPHRQCSPREFRLDELLSRLVEEWKAGLPPTVEIEIDQQLAPFSFFADEKQWRAVLNQLLSNARYALATGGKLSVSLQAETLSDAEMRRLGLSTARVVRLILRDNGFGMTPEIAGRAFEPFFTTRGFIKASGLGLTIVHSITQFYGGQVELETAPDAGAAVTLWLPRAEEVFQEGTGFSSSPSQRARKKVLLVEDDPLMKEVLRSWVAGCHLELHSVEDAASALKMVQRTPSEWVLAICETNLKAGTGESVRAMAGVPIPHVPWVFLSNKEERPAGSAQQGNSQPALVLRKPFSHKAFVEIVQQHVSD